MELEPRTVVVVIVAVFVVAAGVVIATGSLGAVPVVGPLVTDDCGPAETRMGAVDDGLVGEQVVVQGKIDYSLRVEDAGITAFNLDGSTDTVPVYLESHPGEELAFGDCLRVRGVVSEAGPDMEVEGPVVANATVLSL